MRTFQATILASVAFASNPALPRSLASESQFLAEAQRQFEKIDATSQKSKDFRLNARAVCVFNALVNSLPNESKVSFDLHLYESSGESVASIPPGHVMVYTGVADIAKDSSQLAAAIATPIAHIVLRHTLARLNRAMERRLRAIPLGVSPSQQAKDDLQEEVQQEQDSIEADQYARALMTKAGFDPKANLVLLESMGAYRPAAKSKLSRRVHAARSAMASDVSSSAAETKDVPCSAMWQ